jgi:hypothetical protein
VSDVVGTANEMLSPVPAGRLTTMFAPLGATVSVSLDALSTTELLIPSTVQHSRPVGGGTATPFVVHGSPADAGEDAAAADGGVAPVVVDVPVVDAGVVDAGVVDAGVVDAGVVAGAELLEVSGAGAPAVAAVVAGALEAVAELVELSVAGAVVAGAVVTGAVSAGGVVLAGAVVVAGTVAAAGAVVAVGAVVVAGAVADGSVVVEELVVGAAAAGVEVAGAVVAGVVEVDELVAGAVVVLFVVVEVVAGEVPFVDDVDVVVVVVDAAPPAGAVATVVVDPGHLAASAFTHVTSGDVPSALLTPAALSAGTLATATPVVPLKVVICPPSCCMSWLAVLADVPGLNAM